MKIIPLFDRVVLTKQEQSKQTSAAGFVLPDTPKESPQIGKVIAVSTTCDNNQMPVKVDDIVLFSKYGGSTFKIDGNEQIVIKTSDILGIIKD